MSHLVLHKGVPEFNQAVISLWFIAPRATILQVAQHANATPGRVLMRGILPLMTFGETFIVKPVQSQPGPIASYIEQNYIYDVNYSPTGAPRTITYRTKPTFDTPQSVVVDTSYVGIFCDLDSEGKLTAELKLRLQMHAHGEGRWLYKYNHLSIGDRKILRSGHNAAPVKDTAWDYSSNSCLTTGVVPDAVGKQTNTAVDYTAPFLDGNGPDVFAVGNRITVVPDKWHHVLISFDLSQKSTAEGAIVDAIYPICNTVPGGRRIELRRITNSCKAWIALDDTNYVGEQLRYGHGVAGLGDNDVATEEQYNAATRTEGQYYQKSWQLTGLAGEQTFSSGGMPTMIYLPHLMPTAGFPLGIPCVPQSVGHPYHHVEMAEFQMFTDVTMDLSDDRNRRAFIAVEKDSEDKPTGFLVPTKPKTAEAFVRKRPEVLLHGQTDWIKGKNTGSTGTNNKGEIIPSGQFKPTGTIKKYKPDPKVASSGTMRSLPRIAIPAEV